MDVRREGGPRAEGPHDLDRSRRGVRGRAAHVRRGRPGRRRVHRASRRRSSTRLAPAWQISALAQTLLKLTAPGVARHLPGHRDLGPVSLVDPDNRRPVDYALRRRLLERARTATAADAAGRARRGSAQDLADLAACSERARADPSCSASTPGYRGLERARARAPSRSSRSPVETTRSWSRPGSCRTSAGQTADWADTTLELPRMDRGTTS